MTILTLFLQGSLTFFCSRGVQATYLKQITLIMFQTTSKVPQDCKIAVLECQIKKKVITQSHATPIEDDSALFREFIQEKPKTICVLLTLCVILCLESIHDPLYCRGVAYSIVQVEIAVRPLEFAGSSSTCPAVSAPVRRLFNYFS